MINREEKLTLNKSKAELMQKVFSISGPAPSLRQALASNGLENKFNRHKELYATYTNNEVQLWGKKLNYWPKTTIWFREKETFTIITIYYHYFLLYVTFYFLLVFALIASCAIVFSYPPENLLNLFFFYGFCCSCLIAIGYYGIWLQKNIRKIFTG